MIRVVSFLLLPLYTNSFTKEQTGYIFLIFTFIAFAQILFTYGFDSSFIKFYEGFSENFQNTNEYGCEKNSVGRTSLIILLITSIFLSSMIIIFSNSISQYIFGFQNGKWIQYAALILFFETISSRIMIIMRMEEKVYRFFIISFVNIIVSLIASYILVIYYQIGIAGVLLGMLLGVIMKCLLVLDLLINTITKGFFSIQLLKKMVKFGLPFIPAAFFYLVLEMSDRFILYLMIGPDALGLYTIGYKLGSVGLFIITAFNLGWQPFYIKIGNQKESGEIFGKIGTTFLHILISIWALAIFWIPVLIKIKLGNNFLIGEEFWDSMQIVPIIFSSYLFYAGYVILMPSIYLKEKQNWSPIFRGIGALINICLNFYFIKYWGIFGAALATLIAYMTMFLLIFIKSNQWLKILCNWHAIGKHFIITIIFIWMHLLTTQNLLTSIFFTFIYFALLNIMIEKINIYKNLKNLI